MDSIAKTIAYLMYGWYWTKRWFHVQVVSRLTTPSARTFVVTYVHESSQSVVLDVYSRYVRTATAEFCLTNVTPTGGRMWRLVKVDTTCARHSYAHTLGSTANSGNLLTQTLDGVAEDHGWLPCTLLECSRG